MIYSVMIHYEKCRNKYKHPKRIQFMSHGQLHPPLCLSFGLIRKLVWDFPMIVNSLFIVRFWRIFWVRISDQHSRIFNQLWLNHFCKVNIPRVFKIFWPRTLSFLTQILLTLYLVILCVSVTGKKRFILEGTSFDTKRSLKHAVKESFLLARKN